MQLQTTNGIDSYYIKTLNTAQTQQVPTPQLNHQTKTKRNAHGVKMQTLQWAATVGKR
jgi:hypothetical protein